MEVALCSDVYSRSCIARRIEPFTSGLAAPIYTSCITSTATTAAQWQFPRPNRLRESPGGLCYAITPSACSFPFWKKRSGGTRSRSGTCLPHVALLFTNGIKSERMPHVSPNSNTLRLKRNRGQRFEAVGCSVSEAAQDWACGTAGLSEVVRSGWLWPLRTSWH